jgi:hypothetical protein
MLYSLVSVTLIGLGAFQLTRELTSYTKATIKVVQKSIILISCFGVIIMSFVFAISASHVNNNLLDKYGLPTEGYITSMTEDTKKGNTFYTVEFRFYTQSNQEFVGATNVDVVTFKNYGSYDKIGVRYLPSSPDVNQSFFSNGNGNNISSFASRTFNDEDIFKLGNYIADTSGVSEYIRSIEFGFDPPQRIDGSTVIFRNKHRFQRITIAQNNYVEYVSMFDGTAAAQELYNNTKYMQIPVDSLVGDVGYQRDNKFLVIKNMNESIVNFYHYRVYLADSITNALYTPKPYNELEGAADYVKRELH